MKIHLPSSDSHVKGLTYLYTVFVVNTFFVNIIQHEDEVWLSANLSHIIISKQAMKSNNLAP